MVVSRAVGAVLVFGFGFWGVAGEEGLGLDEGSQEENAGVVSGVWV
jgi:hypothetical protein